MSTAKKPVGTVSWHEVEEAGLRSSRAWTPTGPERDAEIVALAADGWTYEAIGMLYDLTRNRIHQIVKKAMVQSCASS